jgi:hypothetical protein
MNAWHLERDFSLEGSNFKQLGVFYFILFLNEKQKGDKLKK